MSQGSVFSMALTKAILSFTESSLKARNLPRVRRDKPQLAEHTEGLVPTGD